MILSEKDIARFWKHVDVRGADECWEWQRGRHPSGYGQFKVGGTLYRAHRVAWQIANQREPLPGMDIAHAPIICHNRACCNPKHLDEKTSKDNKADMELDGTVTRGDRHWTHIHPEKLARGDQNGSRIHPDKRPHGEGNSQAKLTQAKVAQIKVLRSRKPPVPQRVVAEMFDTSQSNVSLIEHGKAWKERETK